jgi:hypothetical protein
VPEARQGGLILEEALFSHDDIGVYETSRSDRSTAISSRDRSTRTKHPLSERVITVDGDVHLSRAVEQIAKE